MDEAGYIRLWRKISDNPVWTTLQPSVLKLMLAFLLKANWEPKVWYDGKSEIAVPRGSFVTSYPKMGEFCNLSRKEVRTAFEHLEHLRFAAYTRAPKWTMVTVVNYAAYQAPFVEAGTVEGSLRAQSGHDGGTMRAPTKEIKNTRTNTSSSPDEANGMPSMDSLPFDTLDELPAERSLPELQEDWFAEFWAKYPRKVDRVDALKAFRKHATSEEQKNQIIRGLEKHLPALLASDKKYRPHAATWLNKRRYEEDPEGVEPRTNDASQQGPRRAAYHQKWPPPTGEVSNG